MMLEHPDITKALRTGHPIDWKEPEPIFCPICGAENPEKFYFDKRSALTKSDVFGCSECITFKFVDDLDAEWFGD